MDNSQLSGIFGTATTATSVGAVFEQGQKSVSPKFAMTDLEPVRHDVEKKNIPEGNVLSHPVRKMNSNKESNVSQKSKKSSKYQGLGQAPAR